MAQTAVGVKTGRIFLRLGTFSESSRVKIGPLERRTDTNVTRNDQRPIKTVFALFRQTRQKTDKGDGPLRHLWR